MIQPSTSVGTPEIISPNAEVSNWDTFVSQDLTGFDASIPATTTSENDNLGNLMLDISFDPHLKSQPHPGEKQLSQQYPLVAMDLPFNYDSTSVPPRLTSSPSASPIPTATGSPWWPDAVGGDGGTYTCTYRDCTMRFESPTLLQKHKRDGHRQARGLKGLCRPEAVPRSLLNTQAGPHKCERINPSTGKPCNTVFSRPYDLTRHEGTIHNARKEKVRCDMCTEEKTFSRADALTRHYHVCHPDLEFPGKHRKAK